MSNNIKRMPVFRGRFGTRSKRKKTNPKWNKWRYPRGIDISWRTGDNQMPKIGFGCDKKRKALHPSGRKEVYIRNLKDLQNFIEKNKDIKNFIFRMASKLGKKKREEIKKFCDKHKLRVINIFEKKIEPEKDNIKIVKKNDDVKKVSK